MSDILLILALATAWMWLPMLVYFTVRAGTAGYLRASENFRRSHSNKE